MRSTEERKAWRALGRATRSLGLESVSLAVGIELDLSRGCVVLAGRNGAGKSRVLLSAKEALGERAVLIQLHQLCEHVRTVLESRADISEMEAENGPLSVDGDVMSDVRRVIGRDYESSEWFSLELDPESAEEDSFSWGNGDDQALIPHFRVSYRGIEYTTLQMGLGELSIHVLFWTLEQVRDRENLCILVDEPDAYLPPIGAARLLARLQRICVARKWTLVVSTHSEEMIKTAVENDGLIVVRCGEAGKVEVSESWVHGRHVADELMADPPVDLILFVEDESAAALARAMLRARGLDRSINVSWANGSGDLSALGSRLPAHSAMKVKFGIVFDGDQRGVDGRGIESDGWRQIFLPTDRDPDELFKEVAGDVSKLAESLRVDTSVLATWLDALEGSDKHDWVNDLCVKSGNRVATLDALADMWVAANESDVDRFVSDVTQAH